MNFCMTISRLFSISIYEVAEYLGPRLPSWLSSTTVLTYRGLLCKLDLHGGLDKRIYKKNNSPHVISISCFEDINCPGRAILGILFGDCEIISLFFDPGRRMILCFDYYSATNKMSFTVDDPGKSLNYYIEKCRNDEKIYSSIEKRRNDEKIYSSGNS